jgi:hypothetical protein
MAPAEGRYQVEVVARAARAVNTCMMAWDESAPGVAMLFYVMLAAAKSTI